MSQPMFDYVVIGAGSAGCVVAARLVEEKAGSVLLLEAGDLAERHPETLSADGFKDAFANDALMWHRMSSAQSDCSKRRLYLGSGKGMGGSGAVNGMVYTRGDRRDYSNWPAGWQWDDVTPAFHAVEQRLGIRPRAPTPFVQCFIDAAQSAGFRRKDGLNDGDLGGYVGCNDMNYAGELRQSSYSTFIHQRNLPKLTIITAAKVLKLIFNEDKTAVGVSYSVNGKVMQANVAHEVILCAGALETPRILLLSGIGPRQQLEDLGIRPLHDAQGVGQHLQDHPNVCLFYRANQPVDFSYPQVYAFDAARRNADDSSSPQPDSCYVCYAAPASIKQSMLRMLPVLALPGALYQIKLLRTLLRGLIHLAFKLPPVYRYVSKIFGIVVILGKPKAQGQLRLNSSNPDDPADINPAYYATQEDRDTMLAAVEKARSIALQPVLLQIGARPLSLGTKTRDSNQLWRWITAATMTTFHYCGSCRMGEDKASPVDARLRVKGLRNVRVADASVIPEIPVSALNAPSMMIGYRAVDFILSESKQ